jgi:hypothetical protein
VIGQKAAQERFSEEKAPDLTRLPYSTLPETHFSTALPKGSAELTENNKLGLTFGTQQL